MNGKTGIPRDDVPNGLTYQKDAELELEDKQKRLDSHFVDVDLNSNSTAPHNDASGHRGTNKLKQQHNSDHPEYLYMHYAITPEPQEFKSPITDKDGEIVQKNSD